MPDVTFGSEAALIIATCVREFKRDVVDPLIGLVGHRFADLQLPAELSVFHEKIERIAESYLEFHAAHITSFAPELTGWRVSELSLPVLKLVLSDRRKAVAMKVEQDKANTQHPDILAELDKRVALFDKFVSADWFRNAKPMRKPLLSAFFPIQQVEEIMERKLPSPIRQYDEKFHILQAPSLFLNDLAYYRAKCEMRGVPVAVAFIDIDDFKALNSRHGHTKVDRNLLPRFMGAMEGQVFARGYAYRFGGDEYAMCMPNMDLAGAVSLLRAFQAKLAGLPYRDIAEKPTVSVGCCVVDADCYLTDREIEERVNMAANFAKKEGKDKGKGLIAGYRGATLEDDELAIVPFD